jgi:translocation and assembly module TamA
MLGNAPVRRDPALVLVLLLTACAHADPDRQVMGGLSISGNDAFSDGEIERHLALVPTSPWPWADPQYFDRGTLAGDERRLLRFYRSQGFYDARAEARVVEGPDRTDVRFVVVEGQPSRVRSLSVSGLEDLPPDVRRALDLGDLPLASGARITEDEYEATKTALRDRLRERGYGDAVVTGEVRVDPQAHAADVVLRAAPGPLLHFGKLRIAGSVHVPSSTIRETVTDELAPGAVYRESALAAARNGVFGMNVFKAVAVDRGPASPATNEVPINVRVAESPLHGIRAGGGAAFEPQRQELRILGDYEDRDFLGGLRLLRFQNRLGYAYLCPTGSGLFNSTTGLLCFQDPSGQGVVGSTALDLTQPRLLGPRVAGNVRVEYERQRDLTYEVADFVRGRLGFPIRLSGRLAFVPSYNVERSFYRRQPLEQDRLICNAPTGGQGCAVTLSRLEESLVWDGRDSIQETTRGRWASLSLSQGGGILGGNFAYTGLLADVRSYHPLSERLVLALRVLGGVLLPHAGESTPITQRFFAGGNSLRSYGARAFGPAAFVNGACGNGSGSPSDLDARRACLSGDPSTTVPVGGNQIAGGSAELRLRVWGDFALVGFADVASVQPDPGDRLRPSLALGGGLRYATDFGPVRLDVGARVLGAPPEVTGTVNGRPVTVPVDEPPFAVHFSIGEAF